ncbi:hypothetical protein H5410_047994 [Solanum commersonii]|uniref:Uncharacterized protein n=1 Tax=Solanum commersonii TaxID=4109 RepID=A0A9J5XKM1_SOLCO|nr:hypothetical protein H5410_047994 [Solanum commersonii]
MGEPSNASMHLNNLNPSDYTFPPESIDSDEHLEHEFTDNDEICEEDDDDDVDNAPNAPIEDQSVNHQSTMISYLDHTEESVEDLTLI